MTANQRRKQNRLNAKHSTGPKSDAGKEASRRNALKHGLTAEVLALPNEDPTELQRQADAFHDAVEPQSHDEAILVDQLALTTIRLNRLATAEAEILSEQVRMAEVEWDKTQKQRLLELSRLFRVDPVKALIELKSFAAGVEWLLTCWNVVKETFDIHQCIADVHARFDVLRLAGYNPETLKTEPMEGYELFVLMCSCEDYYKTDNRCMNFLREQRPPFWVAMNYPNELPKDDSVTHISALIHEEIAALQARLAELNPLAQASRSSARTRAMRPVDTSENRLFLRYRQATEMTFHRTIKTLEKLQLDRQKRAAAKAEHDESRNEADAPLQPPRKRRPAACSVDRNRVSHTTRNTVDNPVDVDVELSPFDLSIYEAAAIPQGVV